MNELIKIDNKKQTTNARYLHEFLGVKRDFSTWIKGRIEEYNFIENEDFSPIAVKSSGGRPAIEYSITLDMAKELAMIEKTDKGKEARQYFITCEKVAKLKLKYKANEAWLIARTEGKEGRRTLTDVIDLFKIYCKNSGSKSFGWYFKLYTDATYKALFIMQHRYKEVRDMLDNMQLTYLKAAEEMASKLILQGMKDEIYYKDIFQMVKNKLIEFGKMIGLSSVPSDNENIKLKEEIVKKLKGDEEK